MSAIIGKLDALDRALVKNGFPSMSAWWKSTLARFYGSNRRQLVARVGRRGGKSSSIARVAVLEALYGEHVIPPGDVGIVGIVSTKREEAAARLRTIKAVLDALRVQYKDVGETIELLNRPIVFRVFTATSAGVVGGTWICAICDEVSRWLDSNTGANPASEVLASLRPTLATMPHARLFLISSPLGTDDAHAKAVDAGDSAFQLVTIAPTWVANPTLTEADCRALEPDERIFLREYAAIPQANFVDGFFDGVIEGCIDKGRPGNALEAHGRPRIVTVDPAFRGDEFALAVLSSERIAPAPPILTVDLVTGWRGSPAARGKPAVPLSVERTVDACVTIARRAGVRTIHGDQHHADSLRPHFTKHHIAYSDHAWSAASKADMFTSVRTMMMDRRLRLPDDPETLRQFHNLGVKILPSGVEAFVSARGASDDRVHAIVQAACLAATFTPLRLTHSATASAALAACRPRDLGLSFNFNADGAELALDDFDLWHRPNRKETP